ncbi:aminoglycoside phosphotransferase [Spongiactinospora gelatinilytica]|uniref:Aminoglycoside phosphotransferase n=1 Tax=Spongiactinospora gelatinilytica TaxID=2666298 RepID=A0A2W2GCY6_9ACTN|nr:phosphotransferase [Spongiactinospora gelatinilytica]PZG38165.1 aminoglycoside phosphotransferase [Spongiactinospora gelatinilytica]
MRIHDLSAGDGVLSRVAEVARAALARYRLSPAATAELINVSENATFRVLDPESGERAILRVHRLGYHSRAAIESELDWLSALRRDEGVTTPRVLPAAGGDRTVIVPDPYGGPARTCVLFEFLPGAEPGEERLAADFERLGEVTARMHRHARRWRGPAGFTRFRWDYDAALGREARWGRWQDGAGVHGEARAVLGRLDAALRARLARAGTGPDRYGLIHADLRLANLLVAGDAPPSVIDFDDCGYGWYLYDLAAALSFIEHHPLVPELIDAWTRGYRTVAPLPDAGAADIWTFIMFRRLMLVAWIGSHPAAGAARELGAGYTEQSCALAERYLAGEFAVTGAVTQAVTGAVGTAATGEIG